MLSLGAVLGVVMRRDALDEVDDVCAGGSQAGLRSQLLVRCCFGIVVVVRADKCWFGDPGNKRRQSPGV